MNRLSKGALLAGMFAGCAHENLQQSETPQRQKVEAVAGAPDQTRRGTQSQINAALCDEKTEAAGNLLASMEFHRTPGAVRLICEAPKLGALNILLGEMETVCADDSAYPQSPQGTDAMEDLEAAQKNFERSAKTLAAAGDALDAAAFCEDQLRKENQN